MNKKPELRLIKGGMKEDEPIDEMTEHLLLGMSLYVDKILVDNKDHIKDMNPGDSIDINELEGDMKLFNISVVRGEKTRESFAELDKDLDLDNSKRPDITPTVDFVFPDGEVFCRKFMLDWV